jgi:methenyltetrahydromethanopterin cyclohydrolase
MFGVELNQRAEKLVRSLLPDAKELRIAVHERADGGFTLDCGIDVPGGLEAGLRLAAICTSGLARIGLAPAASFVPCDFEIDVATDQPVAACMASQYAGWRIASGTYFAMGSGPMRAAAGQEALFDKIGCRESAERVVGVLEARKLPGDDVVDYIAQRCRVPSGRVTLLVAPAASQAGTIQIVARSVETALHKLHELGFDLSRVVSGAGRAPLPPVAKNDLAGIGKTNDAILYGGRVTLWVRGDDASLLEVGPKIPSSASPMHGQPFARIFDEAGGDFYQIDPHLFSPAVITLVNLDTGLTIRHGSVLVDVLERSFNT